MTVKISELPVATEFESGDVIPIVQDGSTKQLDANGNWTFGAIDGTPIGGSTPSTGAFTSADIDGGNIDGTAIGVSSASSGAFTTLTASDDVNFDSGTLFVDASADSIGIGTTSPAKTLDVSGEIRASTGILFGSDTAAANTLDDYEEGTFTPTVNYEASNGDLAYSVQNGFYTKIGNLVSVSIYILWNETTASGHLSLRSLPFVIKSGTIQMAFAGIDNMTSVTGAPFIELIGNDSFGKLYQSISGSRGTITNGNTAAVNNVIRAYFSYLT